MLWMETCPRECDNCLPWANIHSEDRATFICCGQSDEQSRSVPEDVFRLCFRSEFTDTLEDYSTIDLMDLMAVLTDALALYYHTLCSYQEKPRA